MRIRRLSGRAADASAGRHTFLQLMTSELVCGSNFCVGKDANLVWLDDRGCAKVHVDAATCDQQVNLVRFRNAADLFQQLLHKYSWFCCDYGFDGGVYVDLSAAAIVEPDKVRVFANAEVATAYQLACHELKERVATCGRIGGPSAQAPDAHSEAFQLLATASEQDLVAANRRFELVKCHLAGKKTPHSIPARTLRLWVAQYRLAKEQYGNGYVGLLGKTSNRGNR